jgi:hypothetical protein
VEFDLVGKLLRDGESHGQAVKFFFFHFAACCKLVN